MADAAPATETRSTITISNWKPVPGNTLRGFFTVTLPSGLIIHNVSLHEKNRSRWIGLPIEKRGDFAEPKPLIEFTSTTVAAVFRRMVLDALKAQGLA